MMNEGLGIYFSTNKGIAEAYGKYLYTLQLNNEHLLDFKKKRVCVNFIKYIQIQVSKETGKQLSKYIDLNNWADRIQSGSQAIYSLAEQLEIYLENTYDWYKDTTEKEREYVYKIMRQIVKQKLKAYTFNYSIPDIGIIKDVSPEVVKIITRELIK